MICQRGPECGMVSTEKKMRFKNRVLPLTTEKQIHELRDGQESNPQVSISVVVAKGELFFRNPVCSILPSNSIGLLDVQNITSSLYVGTR
jgi:hypothetical protein